MLCQCNESVFYDIEGVEEFIAYSRIVSKQKTVILRLYMYISN